jgi:OmpA-OmpF porin, OOP family
MVFMKYFLNSFFLGLFVLLFFGNTGLSQQVEWASKLLRYSSQYGKKQFSAKQVLGKPNVLPYYGSSPVAWAPSSEDGKMIEYVMVEFENPVQVQQIAVAENLNPGSIYRIYLIDTRKKQHLVFENKNVHGSLAPARMFHHFMELTDYKVLRLKLELDIENVPGMNQIDAIAISDSKDPVKAKINVIDYVEYDGKPENLGPAVNSLEEERLPIISPDGKTLYFARKYQYDKNDETVSDDIFYSVLNENGEWGAAHDIGSPLNNKFHNYVASVSPDGNTLVLANQYNRFGSEGVSLSNKRDGQWTKPKSLKIKSMYNESMFTSYHMGTDGNVIVYAIEQNDSYGDMDIYVSFKETGNKWSAPLNLGPRINTAGIEGSAFLAADGVTLYFASDGFSGFGGLDMYMTKRLDNTWQRWTEPVNLGPVINSAKNEYNYTIPASGDYAYFAASNGQYGASDLYRIPLPREVRPLPVVLMKGRVIDAITNEPLDVNLIVRKSSVALNIPEEESLPLEKGKYGLISTTDSEFEAVVEMPGYYQESPIGNQKKPVDEDLYIDFDESDSLETYKREMKDEIITDLSETNMNDTMPKMEILERIDQKINLLEKQQGDLDIETRKSIHEEIKEDLVQKIEEEKDRKNQYVELDEDIKMVPLKEGQIIRVNNIYFKANKAFLMTESFSELDRVAKFLNDNPGIHVEIGGHTNGLPGTDFANTLSDARAKRVYDYLIESGISTSRLSFKGYGKTKPVTDNSTLAGRKKNQRVELKIIKVD